MSAYNTIRLENKAFLDETVVLNLPHGRIDKNTTGIGATTHEILNNQRNSIIVVPTRALAKSKTNKHTEVTYIGGDTFWGNDIGEIKSRVLQAKARVKIMIVADSLKKFLDNYGDQVFEDFFILYDEIDIFQEDANYRSSLPQAMEYYFKFPETRRALMTATLNNFSDPSLQDERLTIIQTDRKWKAVYAINVEGDITRVLLDLIIQKRKKSPSRNLMIGLNNFRLIKEVIALLGPDFKNDIGVLCSDNSRDKIEDYYQGLNPDGTLPKAIVFATSAYYTGLDINEAPFMIAVSDVKHETTLFSTARLIQFFGRARKPNAQYTFLYNTNQAFLSKPESVEAALLEIANSFSVVIGQLDKLLIFPPLKAYLGGVKDFLMGQSSYQNLPLVQNNDMGYKPSYFTIDHIRINLEARKKLYTLPLTTSKSLKSHFEKVETSTKLRLLTEEQMELVKNIGRESRSSKMDKYNRILDGESVDINDSCAEALKVLMSYDYQKINLEEVILEAKRLLQSTYPIKSLNLLVFQCKMYSKGQELFEYLDMSFPPGSEHNNREIFKKIEYLFTNFDPSALKGLNSVHTSTKYFKYLLRVSERSTRPERLYKVEGLHEWLLPKEYSIREQYNLSKRSA